jgi:hypothetical protein
MKSLKQEKQEIASYLGLPIEMITEDTVADYRKVYNKRRR